MHHHSTATTLISLALWALIVAGMAWAFFRKPWQRPRYPAWEERWRKVPKEERERIAEAARRGDQAGSPDEAFLLAGSAWSQRRYWSGRGKSDWVLLGLGLLFFFGIAYGMSPIASFIGLILLTVFFFRFRRRRAVVAGLDRAETQFGGPPDLA